MCLYMVAGLAPALIGSRLNLCAYCSCIKLYHIETHYPAALSLEQTVSFRYSTVLSVFLYGGPMGNRTPTSGLQSPCAPVITISPIALHPSAVIISHQAPRTPDTITHDLHPLPDRDRSRIASGLSV